MRERYKIDLLNGLELGGPEAVVRHGRAEHDPLYAAWLARARCIRVVHNLEAEARRLASDAAIHRASIEANAEWAYHATQERIDNARKRKAVVADMRAQRQGRRAA